MNILGSAFSILINILQAVIVYGSLALIITVLRKVSKDVADVKRSILDLQETLALMPRPEFQSKHDPL